MKFKHPKQVKILSKVWDVKNVMNISEAGTVGQEELAYELDGWGVEDSLLHIITEDELQELIYDGAASILSYD